MSAPVDYVPGVFRVERHVRGVRACKCCAHLRPATNVGVATWWSMIMAGTRRYLRQVRLGGAIQTDVELFSAHIPSKGAQL